MPDSSRWGDALRYTMRAVYLNPELPQLYRGKGHLLSSDECETVLKWRREASRLGRFRRDEENARLGDLLDAAVDRLRSAQAELAVVCACRVSCPVFGWQDAQQRARDLYMAVRALSRTAGPEVMLADRVAVDLIESMTGRCWTFGKTGAGITRGKRWLRDRGYFTIKFMKGSRTTVYCLVQQGTYPAATHKCLVALAGKDLVDSRPELTAQDEMVLRESIAWEHAKKPWVPGRAVQEVLARLAQLGEERSRQDREVASQRAHMRRFLGADDRQGEHTDFGEELAEGGIRRYGDAAAGG